MRERVPSARAARYRPTAPFVRDAQTGQRRLPTEREVAELVDQLATLTARETSQPLARSAAGAMNARIDGFNGVVLGRATEDGRTETLCVFTLEEGLTFLGLVPVVE